MVDANMNTAYFWACEIFQPELPSSLSDIHKRAKFVEDINTILIIPIKADRESGGNGQLTDFSTDVKSKILNDIAEKSKPYILNEDNNNILINIALRLWAGCMEAAKSIAFETMDGANTPLTRERSFFQIDFFSKFDLIYCAGVEVAPSFKKLHDEYYSFKGVPANSVVRRYPNDYLKDE
jgi:hypothetical protein